MSQGGPSSGNPGVVPFRVADALSAEPARLLVAILAVSAVACVRPQTDSLAMAGHACTCPLMGLLAAATQAHPSLFVVAAAASRACATPRSLPRAPTPRALRWWLPQPCLQVRCWQCLRWGQVRRSRPTTRPLVRAPQRPCFRWPSQCSRPCGQARGLLTQLRLGVLHTNGATLGLQDKVRRRVVRRRCLCQVQCRTRRCRATVKQEKGEGTSCKLYLM